MSAQLLRLDNESANALIMGKNAAYRTTKKKPMRVKEQLRLSYRRMNYPAASRGISSSVLARHSVLDTESSRTFWIPASAGMTNSRQAAGNEP